MLRVTTAVGTAVRKLRETQGLSIRELARAAEVDHSYLSRIESGEAQNPSTRVLRDIAAALGTNLATLERRPR